MKTLSPFILLLGVLASCSFSNEEQTETPIPLARERINSEPFDYAQDTAPGTEQILFEIADCFGLSFASSGLSEVTYYATSSFLDSRLVKSEYPYYQLKKSNNLVLETARNYGRNQLRPFTLSNLDSTIISRYTAMNEHCEKVREIRGFFFRQHSKASFRTDIAIEIWMFDETKQANLAEESMLNSQPFDYPCYYEVYFNSFASITRKDNELTILYSRATWDISRLDKLYDLYVEKATPTSWTKKQKG